MPWTPEHGSTAVPLRTLLTSHPINQHLATNLCVLTPNERLTIDIFGMPPHLCCESAIYCLLSKICTAVLEYRISAYGQLPLIPDIAHIGVRSTTTQNDFVNIWPLRYETYTDEMFGRMTPPKYRMSERRGYSALDTVDRQEMLDKSFGLHDEATSRPRDTYNEGSESD